MAKLDIYYEQISDWREAGKSRKQIITMLAEKGLNTSVSTLDHWIARRVRGCKPRHRLKLPPINPTESQSQNPSEPPKQTPMESQKTDLEKRISRFGF